MAAQAGAGRAAAGRLPPAAVASAIVSGEAASTVSDAALKVTNATGAAAAQLGVITNATGAVAAQLGANRGLLFRDDRGTIEKFRPWSVPSESWLQGIGRMLQDRDESVP